MDEKKSSIFKTEDYLSPEEFEILANFIYHKSGIKMEANKTYLLNNRVQKRIRELRFSGAAEYIRYLKYSDKNGVELQEFLNLVTVNETAGLRLKTYVHKYKGKRHCQAIPRKRYFMFSYSFFPVLILINA